MMVAGRAWLSRFAVVILACGGCYRSVPLREPAKAAEEGRVMDSTSFSGVRAGRIEEVIASRLAGVRLVRRPDGSIALRIRDAGTLVADGEPLFVIDGMPLASSRTGLDFLHPSDIARIELLKDIASTAMYGLRGANGVVLITTKRPR